MRENENAIRAAGANLAAIGLADMEAARRFKDEARVSFPLLVDEERKAYSAVGLRVASPLDLLKPRVWIAGTRLFFKGERQTHRGRGPFQLGGSFVFGHGNVDLFAHVNASFEDDPPIGGLLDAIRTPF